MRVSGDEVDKKGWKQKVRQLTPKVCPYDVLERGEEVRVRGCYSRRLGPAHVVTVLSDAKIHRAQLYIVLVPPYSDRKVTLASTLPCNLASAAFGSNRSCGKSSSMAHDGCLCSCGMCCLPAAISLRNRKRGKNAKARTNKPHTKQAENVLRTYRLEKGNQAMKNENKLASGRELDTQL